MEEMFYQVLAKYRRQSNGPEILVSIRQMEDSDSDVRSIVGKLADKVQHSAIDSYVIEVKRKKAGKRYYGTLTSHEIPGKHVDDFLLAIEDRMKEFEEGEAPTSEVIAYIAEMLKQLPDDYTGKFPDDEGDDLDPMGIGEIEGLEERLF